MKIAVAGGTGVDAVIDATNVASSGKRASSEFFEATARTLMRTAAAAGVRHIVALSIIGIDRAPADTAVRTESRASCSASAPPTCSSPASTGAGVADAGRPHSFGMAWF